MTTARRKTPIRPVFLVTASLVAVALGASAFMVAPLWSVSQETATERPAGDLSWVSWPTSGEAAVAFEDGPIAASTSRSLSMGSISKLVTALMIVMSDR